MLFRKKEPRVCRLRLYFSESLNPEGLFLLSVIPT